MTFTFPVTPEALVSAVEDMGFEAALIATAGQEAAVLSVGGMTCGACSSAVESALRAVPGVSGADVSVVTGKAQVGGWLFLGGGRWCQLSLMRQMKQGHRKASTASSALSRTGPAQQDMPCCPVCGVLWHVWQGRGFQRS